MEEIGISRNNNSRYIYIVLLQTGTVPAKLIKFYTRNPYAHASIAFDSNLSEMYSFARRKRYFCSQFVAYVLYMAGIKAANKVPALVRPEDLRKSDLFQPVYAGRLSEYRIYLNENSLYGVY